MMDRRGFLAGLGAGALGMLAGGWTALARPLWAADKSAAVFEPDLELMLRAGVDETQILPGAPTRVWRFTGDLIRGAPRALQAPPLGYLGPTLRVKKGQKVRLHFVNDLPQESIIHWHGMHVPAEMDGHPRDVIATGERTTYEFEVRNPAGTYWYHPHPHGRTGLQVYAGLAGLLIVEDEIEQGLDLPADEQDMALVLQDRLFDADNQLAYLRHPMERMTGFVGDRILVNGQADFRPAVAARPYRLRLLNGSNSRIYRLAWSDGRPLTVIATDGGLLAAPVAKDYVMLGPAERIDIWVDFGGQSKGDEIALVSRYIDWNALSGRGGSGMMGGMMGGGMMMGGGSLPNGAPFTVARFQVAHRARVNQKLPARLTDLPKPAAGSGVDRRFVLAMQHMAGTINNRVFAMTEVADDEVVAQDTEEIWEFINAGGMPPLPHPLHIHGLSFRVLSRLGTGHRGYVDEGWKDSVLLMPGERVRLQLRFADFPGLFLYHCHNLEHEDMGMMRNYYVRGA